jgi:hypothetical protein
MWREVPFESGLLEAMDAVRLREEWVAEWPDSRWWLKDEEAKRELWDWEALRVGRIKEDVDEGRMKAGWGVGVEDVEERMVEIEEEGRWLKRGAGCLTGEGRLGS